MLASATDVSRSPDARHHILAFNVCSFQGGFNHQGNHHPGFDVLPSFPSMFSKFQISNTEFNGQIVDVQVPSQFLDDFTFGSSSKNPL